MSTELALDDLPASPATDREIVDALRVGDEHAFRTAVALHGRVLSTLARAMTAHAATAEDISRETWLTSLERLDRFDASTSLRTWLCQTLMGVASVRLETPAGLAETAAREAAELAGSPGSRHFDEKGAWRSTPSRWIAADHGRDAVVIAQRAIDELPVAQRVVITMRDVAGWGAADLQATLGIAAPEQGRLLHAARSHVRAALDQLLKAAA